MMASRAQDITRARRAIRPIGGAVAVASAIALGLFVPGAGAQSTTFEAINGCQRYAEIAFKARNASFRRFVIDRRRIDVDRYAGMVGNQYVSTIYRGKAIYDGGTGPRTVRFVCLFAGMRKGAVFVYTLPE